MEIDDTNGANALGANAVSGPEPEMDRDAFMRLLVTQIRNQDPMDPMDTRDMMAQLTELTSVEHLIGIEERLSTLQVGTASIANAQVADFVGREVVADASSLRLEEAGSAMGGFELDGQAESVTVTVRDEDGRVVRTMELGDHFPGQHAYRWDGMDDSGVRLDPGRYRVEIEALDEDGAPVGVHTRIRGTVSGVSYEHGYPELVVGEHRVLMGDVREVSDRDDAGPRRATSGAGADGAGEPGEAGAASGEPTLTPSGAMPRVSPEAALAHYEESLIR
ncbi:MAG TPA: FlgD immunoglobulin-like domain containing protein [Sandaracinaceae bacterium LLY-WYZ-13_1]|nr:FlgD immunoglobulin-like domain containing protein [Sandaracinaceae bacterium LLY-WYZ-13_1]